MKQQGDITKLLVEALSDKPSKSFSDEVMKQLALVKSLVEFGRLVGVAPVAWVDEDDGDGDDVESAPTDSSTDEPPDERDD